MATNTVTRVNTPQFLQGVSLGFQPRDLIADRLSPRLRVGKQSAKYRVFGKNRFVIRKTKWAPGTVPNAIETAWSEGSYFAEFHKLREAYLDAERDNADTDLNLRMMHTENVTMALLMAREKRIADLFTTAANYPGANVITKAGGAEWNVVGGEAPLTDMLALIGVIVDAALVPSTELSVVIPEPVYRGAIQRNSALLDAVKYSARGIVTLDLLAAVLGVREVMLATSSVGGSGLESRAQDVLTGYPVTNAWADNVWIGLLGAGNFDRVPTFSRTFNWQAATGGQERQIRQYRIADEGQQGDWIEAVEALDEKIVFSSAGGVIKNTLSTI